MTDPKTSVRVSEASDDPDWDDFLERTPLAAHTQTSAWGRARASVGWRVVRAVVSERDRIVGGVQMEMRSLPFGGNVGLVFGGPTVDADCPDAADAVLDALMAMGRSFKVRYLAVQSAQGDDGVAERLARSGFRHGILDYLYIYHPASVWIDLTRDLETMFAGLSKSRRQHIQSAEKAGVVIRMGTEADLPVFVRLKEAHAVRLGYERRDNEYYEALWRALAPRGHVRLFIAEYEGEPVVALLVIAFGDTSHHIERPWSGAQPRVLN